jgi:hypothetical protein
MKHFMLLLLALALLLPVACTAEAHQGELIYRALGKDGKAAADGDLRSTVTELDLRLEEAGYERRTVVAMGPGRIRVVLPESVVGQIPKIRKLLERPDGLAVTLELEGKGGE